LTVNSVFSSAAGAAAPPAAAGARRRCHRHRGSRRHAPLLFEHLGEISRLEDGELRQLVNNLGQISH